LIGLQNFIDIEFNLSLLPFEVALFDQGVVVFGYDPAG